LWWWRLSEDEREVAVPTLNELGRLRANELEHMAALIGAAVARALGG
jgi:hypothetical protein